MDHTRANRAATDRRSFLKTGALVAAPLAAAGVPAAALADDGTRARLARLEDERALEALHRKLLQHLNGQGDCSAAIASADAIDLGQGVCSISGQAAHAPAFEWAEDGQRALARCACEVERETDYSGDSTVERMARFQGHGSHRQHAPAVLATEFVKGTDGWQITRATLA